MLRTFSIENFNPRQALFLFLCFALGSCAESRRTFTSGVYQCFQYSSDSSINFYSKEQTNLIWLFDSAVIYEESVLHDDNLVKENGDRFDPERERFVFYRFLDLKTMKGGEYLDLHDTASLQCNFKVHNQGGPLTYNSAFPDAHQDSLRKFQLIEKSSNLPDTIIDGIVNKRIKVNIGNERQPIDRVYFLKKDGYNPFMRILMEPGLEERRLDFLAWLAVYSTPGVNWYDIVGVKKISSTLEPSIVEIFKKWRKNSETTKLPEVNYIDAFRECNIVEKIYLKYDPHMYDGKQIFRGGF